MTELLSEWTPSRPEWFQNESQLNSVREALHSRFADVGSQEECRYLMRLWWHLDMGYQEVSYEELQQFVSPPKMSMLNLLFDSMARRDYESIDKWVRQVTREMPETRDR